MVFNVSVFIEVMFGFYVRIAESDNMRYCH